MSEHEHCGCGCGHDHDHDHDAEHETIMTLTLDDDSELDCLVLTVFPVGEKEYIALLPVEDADSEDGEVLLYRFSETADGEPNLENIEDDDEYMAVATAFDEMLEEMPESEED